MPDPTGLITKRGWRGHLCADGECPADLREALWRDAEALLARGTSLKPGDRTTLVELDHPTGAYVLKRANLKGVMHTIMHWPLRSRARWGWRNAHRLLRAGLHTPRPMALFEERFGPCRLRSYLLTRKIDAPTLAMVIRDPTLDEGRAEALATGFASLWERLGALRLGHGDMKATNFLIAPGDVIWLIDLDGMRRHPPGPTLGRVRQRDRARLLRNFDDPAVNPKAARAFRARFGTAAAPASGCT